MKVKLIVLSTLLILTSCLGTKFLKEGETVLAKQTLRTGGVVDSEELESLTAQAPNSRFLVFPVAHMVYLYEWGHHHYDSALLIDKRNQIEDLYNNKIENTESIKKKRKLTSKKIRKTDKIDLQLAEGNLRMRWGEKLSVYDSQLLVTTTLNLKNYLFAHGYFRAQISTSASNISPNKSTVKIKVEEGKRYKIDSMQYRIEDSTVAKIFNKHIKEQLLQNKPYNQELITAERDRVYDLMLNSGYFNFKKQYILFQVDSVNLPNRRLIVKEIITNPPKKESHKVYKLDSVMFRTSPNVSDTEHKSPETYNGISYDLTNNRYYERVIDWRIFIYPDSTYSKRFTRETQKQLSNLDIFKFVNVNYDTTGGEFNAQIFTRPLNKYQTSFEGGLSVLDRQSSRFPGPFINFNAKNRNTFKGLEILEFNGSAAIQGIEGVNKENSNAKYSRIQYGGNLSLTFPQFLFPLKNSFKARIGQYNPKTTISIGVNFEDRLTEYKRITSNASYNYSWQLNEQSKIILEPLDIAYIKSKIHSDDFSEELLALLSQGNISYVSAFNSSFVSSSSVGFQYSFNNYGIENRDAALIQSNLEYGGLLQTILNDPKPLADDLTYYKYVQGNIDFRQNIKINSKTAFAYRANLGLSYVFGESRALPYEKYYFAGGSNSIRAWQPRRLGPGAFGQYRDSDEETGETNVNYNREQPGDILLELSAEFRKSFIGIIDYALFIDAGNIWQWRSKIVDSEVDAQGDDGVFRINSFLNEIAVGAGLGLRFDFSFLVLRLDAAYKVVDPAMPLKNRFVLDELKFNNLVNKTTLNIGIGYPF